MKKIVMVGAVCVVALVALWCVVFLKQTASSRSIIAIHTEATSSSRSSSNALTADVYPLYDQLTWKSAEASTSDTGSDTITGLAVTSDPVSNVENLSSYFLPFRQYYEDKLAKDGWIEDLSMAADGPGSSVFGYEKNGEHIILSYHSIFKNVTEDAPEQCPCDISFRIFSSSGN